MNAYERPIPGANLDELGELLEYILAGMEGHTDGHQIISCTLQRVDNGGYRTILRAVGASGELSGLRIIQFTNAADGPAALLLAERAYREDVGRWHIDRFNNGASKDGDTETKPKGLTLMK